MRVPGSSSFHGDLSSGVGDFSSGVDDSSGIGESFSRVVWPLLADNLITAVLLLLHRGRRGLSSLDRKRKVKFCNICQKKGHSEEK